MSITVDRQDIAVWMAGYSDHAGTEPIYEAKLDGCRSDGPAVHLSERAFSPEEALEALEAAINANGWAIA